jgi:hypothetical protein
MDEGSTELNRRDFLKWLGVFGLVMLASGCNSENWRKSNLEDKKISGETAGKAFRDAAGGGWLTEKFLGKEYQGRKAVVVRDDRREQVYRRWGLDWRIYAPMEQELPDQSELDGLFEFMKKESIIFDPVERLDMFVAGYDENILGITVKDFNASKAYSLVDTNDPEGKYSPIPQRGMIYVELCWAMMLNKLRPEYKQRQEGWCNTVGLAIVDLKDGKGYEEYRAQVDKWPKLEGVGVVIEKTYLSQEQFDRLREVFENH